MHRTERSSGTVIAVIFILGVFLLLEVRASWRGQKGGVHSGAKFVFQSRDSAFSVTRATLNVADAQVYVHTTTMTGSFFLALRSSGLALYGILRFSLLFAANVPEFVLVVLSYIYFSMRHG